MSKSGTTWTMTYDPDGLRTSRIATDSEGNATHSYYYYYEGGLLTYMKYNSLVMRFTYDAQGNPVSMTYNGNIYFYVLNLQGDVMALLDSSGNEVVSYHYNAWGKLLSTTASTETMRLTLALYNPLRYRGYVYDRETGLYYLQSRYYNPEICRFISSDDVDLLGVDGTVLSYNLYSYCKNNPVTNFDPTGQFLLSTAVLIGAIVGGIVGATVGGVASYKIAEENGAEGWELAGWTVLGAVGGGVVGTAVGAAIGYGVGYLAGGTYANGLAAKTVNGGIKSFVSQANKVHHVLGKPGHNLQGYTAKSMETLMRKTLTNGVVGPYKSVYSAYWAIMKSEVTFTVIGSAMKISDMWIR